VHGMFERWDFVQGVPEGLADLLAAWAPLTGQRAAWEKDINLIAARFAGSTLALRMAGARHIAREHPFFLYLPGVDAVVNGVMDAVLDDGAIIDYKTGKPDDSRHARYAWQLLL